jgi:hypothetical protein
MRPIIQSNCTFIYQYRKEKGLGEIKNNKQKGNEICFLRARIYLFNSNLF